MSYFFSVYCSAVLYLTWLGLVSYDVSALITKRAPIRNQQVISARHVWRMFGLILGPCRISFKLEVFPLSSA
jgi:hypothetical protein